MAGTSATQSRFEWRCADFAKLDSQKLYSPVYSFGKFQWRLLVFPQGLRTHNDISIFVDVADADTLPPRWRREARFVLEVVNHAHPTRSLRKEGSHAFCASERDRGFTELTEGRRDVIVDSKQGFLDSEGALTFRCEVEVVWDGTDELDSDDDTEDEQEIRVDWRYDSKSVTGFVGLANQGATCYLNSLVQALYHLPAFRALVYSLDEDHKESASVPSPAGNHANSDSSSPTESSAAQNGSQNGGLSSAAAVVRALQKLFFRLERSSRAVETLELTRSFGWTNADAFVQHDVQELLRILSEKLEQRSERAKVELQRLFRGQYETRIECVHVNYATSRAEDFYDLSLNVKGCPTLESAFAKYCEDELLCGDDKYRAPDPHGLQDARKGIRFLHFPPVLHLHLKRFELDPYGDGYVKVQDKQSYPLELDLSPYLSPNAPQSAGLRYHLHGVLVHRGQVQSGHYYAFLRPTSNPQWYKFDDSTVVKSSAKRALQDNFGGFGYNRRTTATAYMLIYIREQERISLLNSIGMPEVLKARFEALEQQELEEQKARELARNQLKLFYVTDDVMREHNGADLANPDKVPNVRVSKDSELRALLQSAIPTDGQEVRVWDWVRRQNKSQRPDRPFSDLLASQVGSLDLTDGSLWVWLEKPPLTHLRREENLLFVKWYDSSARSLTLIGRLALAETASLSVVADFARKERKLGPEVPILLWEEVSPSRVDSLNSTSTLRSAELGVGDIVICQDGPLPPSSDSDPGPENVSSLKEILRTPKDYLIYLRKRRQVKLTPLDAGPNEITLEARTDRPLTTVAAGLADVLNIAADRIVLLGAVLDDNASPPVAVPRNIPHDFSLKATLKQAARIARCVPDVLFYDVLPVGITRELLSIGSCIRIRAFFREHPFDYILSTMKAKTLVSQKDDLVSTLLEPFVSSDQEQLQLLAVRDHRCLHRIRADQRCAEIDRAALFNSDVVWVVERALDRKSPDSVLITALHSRPVSTSQPIPKWWGLPFSLVIKKGDSLSALFEAVRTALNATKSEFSSWKLARYDYPRLSHDSITSSEAALSINTPGSAWAFLNGGDDQLVVMHYPSDRSDSHSLKIH